MATKSARKKRNMTVTLAGPVLATPPTEPIRIFDPESGREATVHRTVDTIGMMRRNGTVTPEMEAAARDFAAAFTIAQLDTLNEDMLRGAIRVLDQALSLDPDYAMAKALGPCATQPLGTWEMLETKRASAVLLRSIALGRRWLHEILHGATIDDIAAREAR
jgi:hypothetical protein